MQEDISRPASSERDVSQRRAFSWRTVFFGFTRSRRRDHRRDDDADAIFLDWHPPWVFAMALGMMLMSCADAFLTLELIARGMEEVNPFMQAAMNYGTGAFVGAKLALTATGVLALVFLAEAKFLNRVRAGLFLTVLFVGYVCLIGYELVSLFSLM